MSRIDKKLPLPATWAELKMPNFLGGHAENVANLSDETLVVLNVQILFLAGFSMNGCAKMNQEGTIIIDIEDRERNEDKIKNLKKWLSRKEQPRWHPDRINLRTGREGLIDEGISKKTAVVAMRSAAQALLQCIE